MNYPPQITKDHYRRSSYDSKDRWVSYWYQINYVVARNPRKVLEIGPGNKTVTEALRKKGIEVTTVDIASDLNPDVIAPVTKLPFPDRAFEGILAAEVLEHLPFNDFPKAISEIRRVAGRFAVISLPHAGFVFSLEFKIPLIGKKSFLWKLPFFWRVHEFNGEHYWELGKRGFSVRRIKQIIRHHGFHLRGSGIFADDPAHYFFILEKV